MSRLGRSFLVLSLGLGSLATSCGTQSGLTLTPKPVHLESGGWRDSALAIAAAVAARHELPRSETATAERGNGTRGRTCCSVVTATDARTAICDQSESGV